MESDSNSTFAKVGLLLKDPAAPWTDKRDALLDVQTFVLNEGESNKEAIVNDFRTYLLEGFIQQLEERRAQMIKEICNTITILCSFVKDSFEQIAGDILPALFKLLVVTIKVIADSSHQCVVSIVPHSLTHIPLFVQGTQDAHHVLRSRCAEYLLQILQIAPSNVLNAHLEQIQLSLKKSLEDSSANARATARTSYGIFRQNYPEQASQLFDSLIPTTQKQLLDTKSATNVSDTHKSAGAGLSIREMMKQKRAEAQSDNVRDQRNTTFDSNDDVTQSGKSVKEEKEVNEKRQREEKISQPLGDKTNVIVISFHEDNKIQSVKESPKKMRTQESKENIKYEDKENIGAISTTTSGELSKDEKKMRKKKGEKYSYLLNYQPGSTPIAMRVRSRTSTVKPNVRVLRL